MRRAWRRLDSGPQRLTRAASGQMLQPLITAATSSRSDFRHYLTVPHGTIWMVSSRGRSLQLTLTDSTSRRVRFSLVEAGGVRTGLIKPDGLKTNNCLKQQQMWRSQLDRVRNSQASHGSFWLLKP